MVFIAHSANDQGVRHALKDHLLSVSRIVQSFGKTDMQREMLKYAAVFHEAGYLNKNP